MKKRLFLLLLPLILAGCIRVQIGRFAPTETPTPEMLIVRKTDPRAFVVLCPADGILGEGFPTLEAGGDNW